MPKGQEVELELLGVRESVELLAAVAEIDADQTPPCCLEIAQLCGRLPLCLNVRCSMLVCCCEADMVWLFYRSWGISSELSARDGRTRFLVC